MERLNSKVLSCAKSNVTLAIIYIDLDDFSHINEEYGEEIGDSLMIEIAHRLSGSMRGDDFIARVGSDEFLGYLSDIANDVQFEVLIEKIMRNLSVPTSIAGHNFQITGSVGVRFFACSDIKNPEILVRQADQAYIIRSYRQRHRPQ